MSPLIVFLKLQGSVTDLDRRTSALPHLCISLATPLQLERCGTLENAYIQPVYWRGCYSADGRQGRCTHNELLWIVQTTLMVHRAPPSGKGFP